MLFIELANGVYREFRCIARSHISEFRIALTRASVRTVSDASNHNNRNTETHADLRYRGTLHLDGDGIELTPQSVRCAGLDINASPVTINPSRIAFPFIVAAARRAAARRSGFAGKNGGSILPDE